MEPDREGRAVALKALRSCIQGADHREEDMVRIRRIAHSTFETTDLDRQVEYYTNILGLTLTDKTAEGAHLASVLDHQSVVIRRGDVARCASLAFQVAQGDLDAFKAQVEAAGVVVAVETDAQPTIARQIAFSDLKGTRIEVFEEAAHTAQGYSKTGIVPLKLGHVAFNTTEIRKVVDFYTQVMGFRESDWMGDFFAFLRCGPDHHTVNFVNSPKVKMHHIAFEVRDMAHMQQACDLLSLQGIPLIWGPGRHGIGHNIYTYHHNPDGQIMELFCELDQMNDEELGYFEPRPWHRERPLRPKVWPKGPGSANVWGIMPPDGFLD
jgi:catechol 2,3-dioxygenase-like lactoylglutathione lyase family enzyme